MHSSRILAAFTYVACLITAAMAAATAKDVAAASKPNVIVILTDDQDLNLDSLNYLKGIQTYLTDEGMIFNHHYCTVALCCPSRVNMWTGKAAHNTNVTDLKPPYGGYPKFVQYGWNKKWLPNFLQAAGYNTYYVGKLMNAHSINNYQDGLADIGLTGHDFMLEPGTYQYLNTTLQHNNEKPVSYPGLYATDLVANRSLGWIDTAVQSNKPFFLGIAPVNPHANFNWSDHTGTPPIPAERYANLFPGIKVPRTANFNPNQKSGASWVAEQKQLDPAQVQSGDHYYGQRLRALQAVDDLVNRTIARLEQHNILNNTYIVYTTDNGFHISNHRLPPGKRCPYEEDINVPMIMRGPGIPKGSSFDLVTSHTDLVPTILQWTGASGVQDPDGVAIPLTGVPPTSTAQAWEHVQVEHWGVAKDDTKVPDNGVINTYKAMRIVSSSYSLFYSVWCDGSHEVYDMKTDSQQMNNLYNTSQQLLGVSMQKLQTRLDAALLVLKACAGQDCYQPWSALHPEGGVTTLQQALATKFDQFYANQPKVTYAKCLGGYVVSNELPVNFHAYGNTTTTVERDIGGDVPDDIVDWEAHYGDWEVFG